VQVGLYTAFLPMLIYAVLGTSRPLSVSTSTTIAILAATQLGQVVPDGNPASLLSARQRCSAGGGYPGAGFVPAAGLHRHFISEPVLIGFKAGIGLVIVLDQVPKLLGVHFPKGSFLQNLFGLVQSLPDTSMATLAVGAVMVVALVMLERFLPKGTGTADRGGCRDRRMGLLGLQYLRHRIGR